MLPKVRIRYVVHFDWNVFSDVDLFTCVSVVSDRGFLMTKSEVFFCLCFRMDFFGVGVRFWRD